MWRGIFILALLTLSCAAASTDAENEKHKYAVASRSAREHHVCRPVLPFPKQCRYYRTLLSMDGGGMRGIVTTQILKMLDSAIKGYFLQNPSVLGLLDQKTRFDTKNDFDIDLADYFDAVAGISAGSWMASYIVSKGGANKQSRKIFQMEHIKRRFGEIRPGSIEGLEVYFMEYGVYIYPPLVVPGVVKLRYWDPPQIAFQFATTAGYRPTGLEWTLEKFLGNTKFSELTTSLLIAAFDLNIRASVQFVADRLDGIPSRARIRQMKQNTLLMQNCTEWLVKIDGMSDAAEQQQELKSVKMTCLGVNSTTGTPDVEPKKTTVRTGYVWTRTIPRDVDNEADFSEPGILYYDDMDYHLRDVTRASSAFPMIHPAKNIKPFFDISHEYDLIDGAMVGNNPTLQALIWISSNPSIELRDVAVMSIGTGTSLSDLSYLEDAGFFQWMFPMMMLILDSSAEFVQTNIDFLYYETMRTVVRPNQYYRVQSVGHPGTPESRTLSTVNDVTLLPELREIGEQTALRNKASIEAFVRDFIFANCTEPRYGAMEVERERREEVKFQAAHQRFETLFDKFTRHGLHSED